MSDRMVSRGTRSSGLGEIPSKPPDSKSVTPANGINWRPFSTICSSEEFISGVQHVNELAPDKGRGTVTAN